MRYIIALLAFTNPAWAACLDGEETFMSCQIENSSNTLRVCFTEVTAFYRFGPNGQVPDLEISEPVATVDYHPWGGVGRSIAEGVTFSNGGYGYTVYAGFERMFGDEEFEDVPYRYFGGVRVTQDDTMIADLECARETGSYAWGEGLGTAKGNLGMTWNLETQEWVALSDGD